MTRSLRALAMMTMILALLVPVAAARSEPSTDPRVADIVRAGKIRVGLHLPQFVKDPTTGEIKGTGTGTVIVQIAQAFADHVGVKLELVGNPSPPMLVECLKAGACDVGFLGYVPGRTADVGFAPPHIMVPFTFMVPAGSTIRGVGDVDRAGTRIAVVRSHASTITLARITKHAETISVEIPDEAFELLHGGRADAWAAPRPPLLEYAPKLAGARVLDDRYGENLQAIAVPKEQTARLAYVGEFIEAAKASGLIQRAIERAGERGIEVAPPETVTGTTPAR
jgi:polar amino acid transport system substrate-binding protein